MTTQSKLTATQTSILKAASTRPGGNIEPMPPALRGGVRTKVIGCLVTHGLVVASDGGHKLTGAGYAAIGKRRPIIKGVQNMDIPGPNVKPDSNSALQKLEAMPRTVRPGSKLATIIAAMRKPGGATIATMMADTGWQAHTVRGAISGMVKKRLGYAVGAEKGANGQRAYRIA